MRKRVAACVIATAAASFVAATSAAGQASGPIPHTANGKPDVSGIWQAVTAANWNLQAHSAEKGIPAGLGVVDGDEIPYQALAVAKKRDNFDNRATADPESKSGIRVLRFRLRAHLAQAS